jgi:hypothetical protein
MKRIILSLAILSMLSASCTKENLSRVRDAVNGSSSSDDHGGKSGNGRGTKISAADVPDAVIATYEAKYPSAEREEWKKLDSGNYKVQFFLDNVKFETTFTPSGDVVKEEREG